MPQRKSFYKMGGSQITFKLLDESEEKIYTIFKDNMPVKEDVIVDIENHAHSKEKTAFLNNNEFIRLFPHHQRSTKMRRPILMNGSEYIFDFPFGANNDLNKATTIIKSLGLNPLNYDFVLRRTGEGKGTRYAIITEGVTNKEIENIQQQAGQTQQPLPKPLPKISEFAIPIAYQSINLNADEKALLDYLNMQTDYYSEQRFIELWAFNIHKAESKMTKFDGDRAGRIYNEKYKK